LIIDVKDLKKFFPVRRGVFRKAVAFVKAVDCINFYIKMGETLGLVGESGCGKSTVGKSILRLMEPDEGEITFFSRQNNGKIIPKDILALNSKELKKIKKEMQIIFQDPYSSLDPRMTIEEIISEPMIIHKMGKENKIKKRVEELLEDVGLKPEHMIRYPHQFSGGQRQRIGIARALALDPKLIICDEPVTALDVSVQAQVLNLLNDFKKRFGFSYLLIAHDLSVIKHLSDRIAIMYLGKIVEIAENEDLFKNPKHPYTEALISAVPITDPGRKRKKIILKGDVPSPVDPPAGCYFHPRCPYSQSICGTVEPKFQSFEETHMVACHFADSLELNGVK